MLQIKNIFRIIVPLTFGIGFVMNSCKKENLGDCFKGTGTIETRIREVSDFKNVIVKDKIDLYVTQGPNYEVKIEAGKNLHMNIRTTVNNGTLTIENVNKCNFVRSPKKKIIAYVTLPYLRMVRNAGTGTLYFSNQFIQDSLDIRIANSGDVHASVNVQYFQTSTHGNGDLFVDGKANYSSHYTNGTNYVWMQDLIIQNQIDFNTTTVGECYINAPLSGPMNVGIFEKGNVHYKGNPTAINLTLMSKGVLIKD